MKKELEEVAEEVPRGGRTGVNPIQLELKNEACEGRMGGEGRGLKG